MSDFFNTEQNAHMEYLASVPPPRRSWCGWYMRGECADYHRGEPGCEQGRTLACKQAEAVDDRDDLGEAGA